MPDSALSPHCVFRVMVSATQSVVERVPKPTECVRLLYMCDFPPSNLGGGPILMSRLLKEYPTEAITVLTSDRYAKISPREGRLDCEEIQVELSPGYGRFGLGYLHLALNWLRIPFIARRATQIVRRRQIAAILTVLHGYFPFAVALAARITGTAYVVIAHDDYSMAMNPVARLMTRAVLRNAAHIYSVSPGMQETLRSRFGVDSELQPPATGKPQLQSSRRSSEELSIIFAGTITAAVEDSLRAAAELITSGRLKEQGVRNAKLHLYTAIKEEQRREWGWDHPAIVVHSWISQDELVGVLRAGDILLLPFSFLASQRHTVQTAFPSKTADYLASGTPILVYGPEYSSLVAYARREAFAEIVSDAQPQSLAAAIRRIARSTEHRQALSARALQVFWKYHDIEKQRGEFCQVLSSIVRANPA